jgi:hypothetical protein
MPEIATTPALRKVKASGIKWNSCLFARKEKTLLA